MSIDSRGFEPEGRVRRVGDIAIHVLDREAPVRFAAEELARYLPLLLPNRALDVYLGFPDQVDPTFGLLDGRLVSREGILVRGDGRRYAVSGGSPRAILHAAYALLESLGARWLKPGPQGEVIRPRVPPPPSLDLRSEPAFPRRGLGDGCLSWWPSDASFSDWLEEMRAVVDWMGKMRMNQLFIHFNRLPPGDLSPLLPELEKRGIALELGGHNLPKLLPEGIREREPEMCRFLHGERRPDGNFCVSNPRTLRMLAEGARRYVERLPSADLYHLWPYDAKEDPWCSCPDCRDLSAAEQMWRAVAAAAEGVAAARPGVEVSGLLYHESMDPSAAPRWARSIFGPRERCYLHPIGGHCPRNRQYARRLGDAVDRLGERLSVLEYYGDPILLGRPANRPDLVGSDLAKYRSVGVQGVYAIAFGALSWWLYPVQLYAFARGCWDPSAALPAAQECCAAVGDQAMGELLARYYRLEGEAAGTHLRFCGYGTDGSWATLPFPPAEPTVELRDHLNEMRRGDLLLREASGLLARIAGPEASFQGLVAPAVAAHRLEEAFHRAVIGQMSRIVQPEGADGREAFAAAVEVMEGAHPDTRGVFGTHWMLPWLRRCIEVGYDARP